ncbi:MAG: chemotaxis protein CheX [Ectobacillus sp.]
MNVQYMNALYRAAEEIFQNYFATGVTIQETYQGTFQVQSNYISVILGIHGEMKGQVICSFNHSTAKKIIQMMMGGMEVREIDELGWSAIQEFGNWIAGTYATEMAKESIFIDVTPPVINEGTSLFRSHNIFTSVPIESALGAVDIHISLKTE